jgi:hypothetical protein
LRTKKKRGKKRRKRKAIIFESDFYIGKKPKKKFSYYFSSSIPACRWQFISGEAHQCGIFNSFTPNVRGEEKVFSLFGFRPPLSRCLVFENCFIGDEWSWKSVAREVINEEHNATE